MPLGNNTDPLTGQKADLDQAQQQLLVLLPRPRTNVNHHGLGLPRQLMQPDDGGFRRRRALYSKVHDDGK